MIPVPRRILVARDPVDFRKGIAGLAAVCELHLGEQPLDGTLFVDLVEDSRTLCTWDTFEEFHRAEFIERVKELEESFEL